MNIPITSLFPSLQPKRNELMSELLSEVLVLVDFECPLRKKKGMDIPSSWQSSTVKDEDGNIVYLMLFGVDIHIRIQKEDKLVKAFQKLKKSEKELEMVNKELDSFAYTVSHDLRSPLWSISELSQILLKEYGDKTDDKMQNRLGMIRDETQKMAGLIDDILHFSRTTKEEINFKTVDVRKITYDIIREQQETNPDRNIEFIVNTLPEVEADEKMVKVIFTNLIGNAVKFTGNCDKARVEIGGEKISDDEIQLFVKDNGVGFDMKYKNKLFGAFQRLHSDEEFTGSGIGLATVQRLVSKHGGRVWAESEVDKGTTFFFTLPPKKHVGD